MLLILAMTSCCKGALWGSNVGVMSNVWKQTKKRKGFDLQFF